MWELGIGGLLAVVVAVRQRRELGAPAARPDPGSCCAWAGLAAIAWTAATYTGKTPFPGWQALLPVARHRRRDRRALADAPALTPAR